MTDELKNALVHRPPTGLVGSEMRTSPVIARITQDVLARAQASGLSRARFRIGDYVLREPDYRQILLWAEALKMVPETLLTVLAGTRWEPRWRWEKNYDPITFALEDGAIVRLAWDFDRLPVIPMSWLPGLLIRALGFCGAWPDVGTALKPVLPRLQTLVCGDIGRGSVDFSQVPGLTKLYCGGNQLPELDLSPVPRLTRLTCISNQLTGLDLSPVPGLTRLGCISNQLKGLDLSPVPGLIELSCSDNLLTVLDLSPVPGLIELSCGENPLGELDLSPIPRLTKLYCDDNQLTKLDLAPVPGLTKLDCGGNQLTVLDLSPVPELVFLMCYEDVRLLNPPAHLRVIRSILR
jgi:Leucine-rich repeat (LRR) protein